LKINGVNQTVDADDATPLLWMLGGLLGMTGQNFGCVSVDVRE
jgi:aerobic-type carbon monoxide dehydrogenase small subunit (CoxS/CutS family)